MYAEREPLTEIESDLKATSDDIAADAERIREIELEKTGLAPGDPRLVELARESEAIAGRMLDKTKAETALVDEAGSVAEAEKE